MENFEIFVRSPFGKYRGTLSFSRNTGRIIGTISFMFFSSDFSGAENGKDISFAGSLETPIGTIDYDARATVSENAISGSAKTRLGVMTFSSKEGR